MNIALLSKAFLPNVGGIETSTAMMARTWHAAGHVVEVVTAVSNGADATEAYCVTRVWRPRTLSAAVRRADLVVVNGYSRAAVAAAVLHRRRLIVFHQGYQLVCRDGIGLGDRRRDGFDAFERLKWAVVTLPKEILPAVVRLAFDAAVRRRAFRIDHVVPGQHAAAGLGLSGYKVIYQPPNPEVVDALSTLGEPTAEARVRAHETGDVVFFGRLVFEKGCEDLLRAYALWQHRWESGLRRRRTPAKLTIYGRGPELPALERLAADLNLAGSVEFHPFLAGGGLARAARDASVVVIPSRWVEPGATIAVELFACGAAVIASENGAQGEIFSKHGRLFPNGDVAALARALEEHFTAGPIYPRPSGDEPWSVSAIREALIRLPQGPPSPGRGRR